ncbi:MAG TPA: MFS transporter [Micromonosporaceae bacterium]|nr:MFS transporter [Micromonosporaceae bacterium]
MRGQRPETPARHDIALLAGLRGAGQFGAMVTLIAIAVSLQPRGPYAVAASMVAGLAPTVLLGPFTGRLLDRLPNRPLMTTAYLVQAACALSLAGLLHHVAAAVALPLFMGAATAVVAPAQSALVPIAAGKQGTAKAYSYMSISATTGFLAGLATAGLLVQELGSSGALLVSGVAFAAQAGAVLLLRSRRDPRRHDRLDPPAGAADRPPATNRWPALADPYLRVVLPGFAVTLVAAASVNVASVFLVVGELHASPLTYGLVEAAWGVGLLAGGWFAGRPRRDSARAGLVPVGGIALGAALSTAGTLVSIPSTVAAWVVGGAANAVQTVSLQSLIGTRVPAHSHGRAFGGYASLLQASNLLALLLGSFAVAAVGAPVTLTACGVVAAAASAVALVALAGSRRDAAPADASPLTATESGTASGDGTGLQSR